MKVLRKTRLLALILPGFALGMAIPAHGQAVSGQALAGDWVRIDSNNDPNDMMRITIGATGGVLTSVPAPAAAYWKVGDVLWQAIQGSGSLKVRGSDGNYYDADLTLNGPDEIHLTIHLSTAGDDQTWRRAGPDISGDWVRVAPPGTPGDGTRIQVQGVDASVRYITATAPPALRIGSRIWQTIGASGGLQVLGDDGQHHAATWSLVATDRIQVNAPAIAGGPGQIWVRPTAVAGARATVRTPPANPNAPGAGLTTPTNLPGIPTTPSTPPVSPAVAPACIASSLPHDPTGVSWGWGLTTTTTNSPLAESIGIQRHLVGGIPSGAGDGPLEMDVSRLSGFQDGFAYVWGRRSRRFVWTEHRDLTAAALDQQNQAARGAGQKLSDIVVYQTSSGVRYAGIWEANLGGVDWKLEYDRTSQEFAQDFQTLQGSGYRLIDIEVYPTSGGLRYAAIWLQSCDNTNWREVRGLDRTEYQDHVDTFAAQGFQVIDFESYQTSAGQHYAAIWEQIPPGRAWAVRTDRTLNAFLNDNNQFVDEGLRLVDFESYDTANGLRYGGVWAEHDARYDMPFKAALDDSIQAYRTRHAIPGVSVVVMEDDEVIYSRGFGWADSARTKRAHSGTIYLTASIAKIIGATLAARLEQQGRLDLSDTTANILDYIGANHTHTVEQLLSKTGCIRHYDTLFADPNERKNAQGRVVSRPMYFRWRRAAIDSVEAPLLPNCMPGRQYHYSTLGFTYVGAVLEEVLGEDIEKILTDELFQPFQLRSMKLADGPVVSGPSGPVDPFDRAAGYVYDTLLVAPREVSYEDTTWKVLGGGLEVDALDLARFGLLTLNGSIVSFTTRDNTLWRSRTGSAVNYSNGRPAIQVGLGWNLRNVTAGGANRRVAEHGGSGRGARPQLQVYRDDGIVIAIMTNQNEAQAPATNDIGAHPVQSFADVVANVVFSNLPP